MKISKDWTPKERLYIIRLISNRFYGFLSRYAVSEEAEKIYFLSAESSEFLENNKDKFLKANRIPLLEKE